MKSNFFFTLLLSVVLFSCSKNEETPTETIDPADLIPTTYYPLNNTSFWKYKVSAQGSDSDDILTVGNNVTVNNLTYQKMIGTADPSGTANGFYTTTLNNNNLRRDGSAIKLTGAINFNFPGLSAPIAIPISDFIIFKQNGATGTELSAVTGTISQTVAISSTEQLPLTFDYKLKSVAGDNLASFTANAISYTNVKKTNLILSLKITTTQTVGNTPVTIVLMDTQDVSTSVIHNANNIGMVYCNTLFSYNLNAAATQFLPATIPPSMNVTQEEFLKTYQIN